MPDTPDPSFDPDSATIPLSGPRPTLSGSNVDLPLPEELAKLLPAGAYEVTSFLGAGGMGAVYKGMQIRLKRPVAIKIMRRDLGKDHDFEARFEREAQAMAKLNHPNIISVIDFGEAGPDYLFIVMELVDGTDLMDVIRSKQMTQEMALTLLPQICDALQFAHDHGIVHRDIKPSNIMLTRDGRVKMADFGLAKHFDHADTGFRTQTGTGMGTPDYAAPEQFDPTTPVDHRADIYALGVMIYQMITGALPRGVWRPPSQRAPVSTQWDAVVSRAMQNDPSERYQKASEVKTELSSIPLHSGRAASPKQPSPATPPSGALGQSALPKSRAPLFVGLVVGAIVIAVGAFFALRGGGDGKTTAPSPAAKGNAQTTAAKAPATPNAPPPPASFPAKTATPAPPTARPAPPKSSPASAEAWANLFQAPEKLALSGNVEQTPTGLLLKGPGNALRATRAMPQRDGAVRMRFTYTGDEHPQLLARHEGGTAYQLFAPIQNGKISLGRWDASAKQYTDLASYRPEAQLQKGQTYELELRVVGSTLTAKFDGKVLGSVTDTALSAGQFGLGRSGSPTQPAKVDLFEFLDLDAPAATTPTPIATTALPESGWQKVITDWDKIAKTKGATVLPGEWVRLEKGYIDAPGGKDGALKATFRFKGHESAGINIRERNPPGMFCRATITGDGATAMLYRQTMDGNKSVLAQGRIEPPLRAGEDYELAIAGKGDALAIFVNGKAIAQASDNAVNGTSNLVWARDATEVKAIYWHDLKPAPLASKLPTDATSIATATKAAPFTNTLGMKFVPVPGTQVLFSIWHTRVQDYAEFAKAQEAVGKKVDASWKTQQKDGVPVGREPDHPLVGVNWDDAQAFCQWLTEKETAEGKLSKGAKYRLPTDAEWSTAIGLPPEVGATPEEKSIKNDPELPWGKAWPPPPKAGNYADEAYHAKFPLKRNDKEGRDENLWIEGYTDGFATTSPVGAFPANKHGLHDMGGNAWQWCQDSLNAEQQDRVLRGASWEDRAQHSMRSSSRRRGSAVSRLGVFGFRCVLEPAPAGPPVQSASAEPWQDMLRDPAKLILSKTIERTAEGLRFTESGSAYAQGTGPDGGIRIRTPFGGVRPAVRARESAAGFYALVLHSENTAKLTRYDTKPGRSDVLQEFQLKTPLRPGQDYVLELRASGRVLTAILDGATLGTVTDDTYPSGGFCVGITERSGSPTVLKAIEVLKASSSSFLPATKDAPFVNSLGMKFVPKSPGSQVLFAIWETRRADYAAFAQAKKVNDYWKTPKKDGVEISEGDQHPVVGVNWAEAKAFCDWLNEKEVKEGRLPPGMRYRLPTDDEWSSAVRLGKEQGATPEERHENALRLPSTAKAPGGRVEKTANIADESFHALFPLAGDQNRWLPGYTDGYATTAPVGSFPANEAGIYDLIGNAWEWCEDSYSPADPNRRVMRGGCWDSPNDLSGLAHQRGRWEHNTRSPMFGFRVVIAPSGGGQTSAAAPQPSAEQWINLLAQPARLALQDTAAITPQGLSFTGAGSAYAKDSGPDGGVRIRVNFGPKRPELRARQTGSGNYTLSISSANTLTLSIFETPPQRKTPLRTFTLSTPLIEGEDYTLELRASGPTLTVVLNGTPLGSVSDGTHTKGDFNVGGNTGHVIKSYEVLVSPAPSLPVSPSPSSATKEAPFINTLGMKFAPVPITGGPTVGKRVLFSVWPVRAQDFDAFLKEQGQSRPKTGFEEGPAHPAIGINWFDAQAFCAWLTTRERTAGKLGAEAAYRLPSDHEWSCALEIGAREDANKPPAEKHLGIPGLFPWGTQWPPPKDAGNFAGEEMQPALAAGKYPNVKAVIAGYKDGFVNTSPVGSFPASRLGLHDLTGNVWQWCEDWADAAHKTRVLRGGSSQDSDPKTLHITYRNRYLPEARFLNHGFRVVLEAK